MIKIYYKKKIFVIKLNKKVLFNFLSKIKLNNNNNLSIICYNYYLILKIFNGGCCNAEISMSNDVYYFNVGIFFTIFF